jgi:serine/threonine protein phosphatase PrpC
LTGGIALSRALGDHLMKEKDNPTGLISVPFITNILTFSHGNRLIVASDGLWDIGMIHY